MNWNNALKMTVMICAPIITMGIVTTCVYTEIQEYKRLHIYKEFDRCMQVERKIIVPNTDAIGTRIVWGCFNNP
jgi:hypothetical protein